MRVAPRGWPPPRSGRAGSSVLGFKAVGEFDPSALRACPEQMMGSKSRMQGKVSPERSATTPVYVGIDVCKERLDVYIHPLGQKLYSATSAEGIKRLKRSLKAHEVALVVDGGDRQVPPRRPSQPPCRRLRRRRRQSVAFAAVRRGHGRAWPRPTASTAECWRSWAKALSPAPPRRTASSWRPLQELVRCRDAAVVARTALLNQLGATHGSVGGARNQTPVPRGRNGDRKSRGRNRAPDQSRSASSPGGWPF